MAADLSIAFFDPATSTLGIDFRPLLDVQVRLGTWDRGLVLERLEGGAWGVEDGDPGVSPLAVADMDTLARAPAQPDETWLTAHPVEAWAASIPASIRELARPIEWRQMTLLWLLREVPEAVTLLADNPVLIWLLVNWLVRRDLPVAAARNLVLGSRARIARTVAGVSSAGVVRLLGRLRFRLYGPGEMRTLEQVLGHPTLPRDLVRLRAVAGDALPILLEFPGLLAFPCLRQLVADAVEEPALSARLLTLAVRYVAGLEHLAGGLGIENFSQACARCRTEQQLVALHDRWTARFNVRHGQRAATVVRECGRSEFPDPPVPGMDTIRPLRTVEELLEEGAKMHHCAGSYYHDALDGRSYFYAVLAPERATLELRLVEGRVVSCMVLLACNKEPSPETLRAVKEWLRGFLDPRVALHP